MVLLHVCALLVTLGFVLYADSIGVRYILGSIQVLPRARVQLLHRLVWVGLGATILSGALMVLQDPSYYVTQPTYLLKMFFVLVLCINAFAIGHLSHRAVERGWRELPAHTQAALLVSGMVSVVSWCAAVLLGLKLSGWW